VTLQVRLERSGYRLGSSHFAVERLFELALRRADAGEAAALVSRFGRTLLLPRLQAALLHRLSSGPRGSYATSNSASGASAADGGPGSPRMPGSRRANKQRNRDARLAALLRGAGIGVSSEPPLHGVTSLTSGGAAQDAGGAAAAGSAPASDEPATQTATRELSSIVYAPSA
jgi:hypothetical protein